MAYACFQTENLKLEDIQCYSVPFLICYGSTIHCLLLYNNVNKRNIYLKFRKINVRFFILGSEVFKGNFSRGPPFFFVA